MPARFRIRTAQGQELSFASRESFAEFVRSGDLAPDDVVYDAETREWSSARTHPVVLQIELEVREAEADAPDGGESVREDEAGDGEHVETRDARSDIDLDLAPVPRGLSPEEEAARFVAKMEAERASDLELDHEPSIESFMVDPASEAIRRAPPPEPAGGAARESEGSRRAEPKTARRSAPRNTKRREKKPKPSKRGKAKAGGGRKLAPFMILAVAVVAAAVYLGPDLLAPSSDPGGDVATDSTPPEPPPLIPATEEALRRRAQERFISSTQALLRGLQPIPDVWLHGQYLAAPSDYPHVREVWESYLTTIRQVRAGDDERYRTAYLRAEDDARIQGSSRTLRLAAATGDFRADSSARAAFYDRVEALATAAIQGHDALVEAEGTISYEPAAGPRVSADPVIEAAGRSAEAQALLDRVLDTILEPLHAEGGPGESRSVREWVSAGFLDAAAG